MIVRMWHGRVPITKADAYREFLKQRALPDYQNTPGNVGSYVLERESPDSEEMHFMTVSLWFDMGAVEGFAGSQSDLARYYPEDADFLLEFEPYVIHYEVSPIHRSVSEF